MMIPLSINLGSVPKLPNGKNTLSGGTDVYIVDGKKHRTSGPAEVNKYTGYEAWFIKGVLHRRNGPAVIDPEKKIKEYWEDGKFLRRETL